MRGLCSLCTSLFRTAWRRLTSSARTRATSSSWESSSYWPATRLRRQRSMGPCTMSTTAGSTCSTTLKPGELCWGKKIVCGIIATLIKLFFFFLHFGLVFAIAPLINGWLLHSDQSSLFVWKPFISGFHSRTDWLIHYLWIYSLFRPVGDNKALDYTFTLVFEAFNRCFHPDWLKVLKLYMWECCDQQMISK